MNISKPAFFAAAVLFCMQGAARAQRLTGYLETGYAFPGYNEVRVPGDTGTRFSLTDDFEAESGPYGRARLTYALDDRHALSVLVAPLSLTSGGVAERPLSFAGTTFAAGTRIEAVYRFDSYRATYRYTFHRSRTLTAGIGLTAKIRDAAIRLSAPDGVSAEKTNIGLVPLVHFDLRYRIGTRWAAVLVGDALAAPQGRAEDVLAALSFDLSPATALLLGYRVLEGGADNDEVYNFALVNYLAVGIRAAL